MAVSSNGASSVTLTVSVTPPVCRVTSTRICTPVRTSIGSRLVVAKPGLFDDDAVIADRKVRRGIQTFLIRREIESAVRVDADDLDLRAGYDSPALISHHSLNRAAIDLGT